MRIIFKTTITFCITAIIAVSCSKKIKNTDCIDVFCTQDLRSIDITVINNSTSALPLTIKVTDLNANQLVNTISTPNFGTTNEYSIFGDGNMAQINQVNTNEPFKVDFLLGANTVKTEIYEFKKDCCHVSKSNGEDSVTIN